MKPPWLEPDTFSVSPIDPWKVPPKPNPPVRPDFADDEELKNAFGIELGRGKSPFDAGMIVFNEALPKALWASTNWVKDAAVIATKDAYEQAAKRAEKPLDKEELLAKVLSFADDRDTDHRGVPLVEAKVRLDALKLYSEISGFTGKALIDASTNINNTTNTNNTMKIVLVKGADVATEAKTIDHSNTESKMQNDASPISLKLVGGTTR